MSKLTGNKDVDILIIEQLEDRELSQVCQVNKYVASLCSDERFWRRRVLNRFGKYLLELEINVEDYNKGSWQDYYKTLTNIIKLMSK